MNDDCEYMESPLGIVPVRRSTIRRESLKEYNLPITVFDQAIQILQEGLHHINHPSRYLLIDVIREFSYFKALEREEGYYHYLNEFVDQVEYKQFKKGQILFHQGDKGDYFYLVLKGKANVYGQRKDSEVQQEKKYRLQLEELRQELERTESLLAIKACSKEIDFIKTQLHPQDYSLMGYKSRYYQKISPDTYVCLFHQINSLKQGDCFGEVSLYRNEPRAATILAVDTLHVAAINKSNYMKIFGQMLEKLNFSLGFLSTIFKESKREVVVQLSYDFMRQKYKLNQTLFQQGQPVDGLYIIQSGVVEAESNSIKINQFGEEQFVGLYDFKHPQTRTYTAISKSSETVVFFMPVKYQYHLDYLIKARLTDMQIASERFRINWMEKCRLLAIKQERKNTRKVLNDVQIAPKEVLLMCLRGQRSERTFNVKKQSISEDRIKMIMDYNSHMHRKTERPPERVQLCLQMKDFEKEREFIARQILHQRSPELPRMKSRINYKTGFFTTHNKTPTSTSISTCSNKEFVNIHTRRLKK